jgi:hypothetical protein
LLTSKPRLAPGLFCFTAVIPGRAKREPGIHFATRFQARWIPGSMLRIAPE